MQIQITLDTSRPEDLTELEALTAQLIGNPIAHMGTIDLKYELAKVTPDPVAAVAPDAQVSTTAAETPDPVPPVAPDTPDPVPPSAPVIPVAPAAGALVDERGVPWNADFHAKTQTKKQDGSWKSMRGVDKEALAAYEAPYLALASTEPTVVEPVPLPGAPVEDVSPTQVLRDQVSAVVATRTAPSIAGVEMLKAAGIAIEDLDNATIFDNIASYYAAGCTFGTLDDHPDHITLIQQCVDIVWER